MPSLNISLVGSVLQLWLMRRRVRLRTNVRHDEAGDVFVRRSKFNYDPFLLGVHLIVRQLLN